MLTPETVIEGLHFFSPKTFCDSRGDFTKLIHEPTFLAAGLRCKFTEHYVSTSRAGVIRGMHFQTPPHDHEKLVVCLSGLVLDVIVDLRLGSPTFSKIASRELRGNAREGFYIPRGCAHGFLSLSDDAVMSYHVTSVHDVASDQGVRYDSLGFVWPHDDPVVSDRDSSFPKMAAFASPFVFRESAV